MHQDLPRPGEAFGSAAFVHLEAKLQRGTSAAVAPAGSSVSPLECKRNDI